MLKFYYNQVSLNTRRVWVALLEKQIQFQPLEVNLNGEQFSQEFTEINPLQQIPVIEDNELRVIDSLAILDYLEAKYPHPSLIPVKPVAIAMVRMVEMITVNELQPAMLPFTRQLLGLDVEPDKLNAAHHRVMTVIQMFENFLDGKRYFVDDKITLADIVAGTLVPSLALFGFALEPYPHLKTWLEHLNLRASWQQTTPKPEVIEAALPAIRKILERRS
uniref:Glutathione S-transferase domain protein n=1 Tax=Cyanothece sp. (strain PCC 7425 / ATCC 29141) TaxID=395961 RepID=B8HZD0_CYAP4